MNPKKRFIKKAFKLAKVIKPLLGCVWYKKLDQEQKDILNDITYMDESMIDFLLLDDGIKSKNDYFNSIDVFLLLESKTFNYKHPLKYKVGSMSLLTKQIYLQHDFIDLKNKIGLDG